MGKVEAMTQLAELLDEQAQRLAAVEAAGRVRDDAERRLSQLRGAMALDGTNLEKRIEKARQEMSAAADTITLWPDVQAELERRIAAAKQAVHECTAQEMRDELASLLIAEAAQRRAFADQFHAFAKVGFALRQLLDRKRALKTELFHMGILADAGETEFPAWGRYAIGQQAGIDEAIDMQRRLAD